MTNRYPEGMPKKDNCGDKDCDHTLDNHHKEIVSTGDVNQERVAQYFNCLAPFCECKKYVPPET